MNTLLEVIYVVASLLILGMVVGFMFVLAVVL